MVNWSTWCFHVWPHYLGVLRAENTSSFNLKELVLFFHLMYTKGVIESRHVINKCKDRSNFRDINVTSMLKVDIMSEEALRDLSQNADMWDYAFHQRPATAFSTLSSILGIWNRWPHNFLGAENDTLSCFRPPRPWRNFELNSESSVSTEVLYYLTLHFFKYLLKIFRIFQ